MPQKFIVSKEYYLQLEKIQEQGFFIWHEKNFYDIPLKIKFYEELKILIKLSAGTDIQEETETLYTEFQMGIALASQRLLKIALDHIKYIEQEITYEPDS